MEEKKRIAKGIKLNASQLPLTNKADFVIGKDSRKVLDNKIIENLGGGSHGYFPSSFGNEYKTWSVSRELEIPALPADADEQMKMIEGATSREPLQNEFSAGYADPFFTGNATPESDPFFTNSTAPESADPFFTGGAAPSSDPFFMNEAMSAQVSEPPASPVTPAQDPSFAPNLADTCRETLPKGMSWTTQPVDDAPSPWGAPSGGTQERYVVTSGNSQIEQQAPSESPWAGPPEVTAAPISQPEAANSYTEASGPQPGASNSQPEAPETAVDLSAPTNPERASDDADMLPDWMNTLVFDATVSSELQSVESDETIEGESTEHVELEKFLSSIPDEEFVIDNETMRHLFSSLCEPKATTKKIKSAASEAADLAIAAAAADILKSEVSIDEISIDDLSTREMREKSQNPGAAESEAAALAEFEAIQKAYAMLDLTPLSSSQRKESFGNVYDVVEKAAAEQVNANQHEVAQAEQGIVARTERGTIEMAIHAGGRQLIPTYNHCGMLTGVAMSDGLSFILSEEKNIWHMIEQSGKVMVSGIQSVSFDKHGNLSYVTKRGDTVTLKIDGSVDTKFAKKTKGMSVEEGDKAARADDANVAEAKEVSEISRDTEPVVHVDSFDGTSDSAPDAMTEKGSEVPAKAARPGAKAKSEKKSEKEPAKGPAKEPVKSEIESRPAPKAQSKPAAKSKPQADTKASKPAKKPKPKKKGR